MRCISSIVPILASAMMPRHLLRACAKASFACINTLAGFPTHRAIKIAGCWLRELTLPSWLLWPEHALAHRSWGTGASHLSNHRIA